MTPAQADALLFSLLRAALRGATLAWAVEHAPDGRDPVPEAWARAATPVFMHALLPFDHPAVRQCDDCVARNRAWELRSFDRRCARCVAELRARVPTMTLATVLATVRPEDA